MMADNAASTGRLVRQRVFSGIQPTGTLHLGNYVGAVSLWVALQADYDTILSIADLHTLTVPDVRQAARLQQQSRQTAATLLACGIDPDRATLFVQSHVRAHVELAWLLACVTPIGWLQRMIQFKTRAATLESVGLGLLAYPVLQAADILLYRADVVPVGEDQQQHIELTREIVRRFHALFGDVFTLPQVMLQPTGARIMSLDDPNVKMSKSLAETRAGHAIGVIDPPDAIRYAVMHAVTDSGREIRPEHVSPGVANLLTIYQILAGRSAAEVSAQFAGKGYAELKRAVADLVVATFEPIRLQYLRLRDAPETLDAVLANGAERARTIADQTLDQVQKLIGLDGSYADASAHLPSQDAS
jgi:tryptophanyl-tRNA synthetase